MNEQCSCEELLELINNLIDGELDGEKLSYAQALVSKNPQCRAIFHTVSKTISLYRMRRSETESQTLPVIDWAQIEKKLKNNPEV